eukprot:5715009-Pleurochrysis_carterae.AAC.2
MQAKLDGKALLSRSQGHKSKEGSRGRCTVENGRIRRVNKFSLGQRRRSVKCNEVANIFQAKEIGPAGAPTGIAKDNA